MTTPEAGNQNPNPRTPGELMAGAKRGFDVSYEFVRPDANILRVGAANIFVEGAGALLYERLSGLGIHDDQIEELAANGLLEETLLRLAPEAMREIQERTQALDTDAKNALQNEIYYVERNQGITGND